MRFYPAVHQIFAADPLRWSVTYLAVLLLLLVFLTVRVIARRRANKVGIGDGGDKDLARAIRVQGNFAEQTPLPALALVVLPVLGAPVWLIHLVGLMLVCGRLSHARGLGATAGGSIGRTAGMVLTLGSQIFGAVALLWLAWLQQT